MFQKGVENLNHLPIVLQPGIAEAQKVADERVVRMRCDLALERRNSFHVKLGPEAGQSPVAVQAGEIRLPRGSNWGLRSEEHTSELQSRGHLVCRLLL